MKKVIFILLVPIFIYVGLCILLSSSSNLDRIVKNEDKRIEEHYKQIAADMLNASSEEKARWLAPKRNKGEGWTKTYRVVNNHARGYAPAEDGKTYVWVMVNDKNSKNEEVYIQKVDTEEKENFRIKVLYMGIIGFLCMAIITGIGIYNAYNYAKSRDDFMKSAAHDLATPLVGLRMCIGRSDKDAKNLTERMILLVDTIRSYVHMGGRKPTLEKKTFNLKKVYDEAYALFRDDFRDETDGEELKVYEANEEPMVMADEMHTLQILWNLLQNVVKYAARYGNVKAEFIVLQNEVQFILSDKGKGLSKKEMRKVFKRYYRAPGIEKTGKGGFGIGLSTAHQLAKAMGGSLAVKSNVPSGCVFTLTLPRGESV